MSAIDSMLEIGLVLYLYIPISTRLFTPFLDNSSPYRTPFALYAKG